MRPELIENPTFLRYYEKWQRDPSSIVFAAIAEIFRSYGMFDEAIKIAETGLAYHPNLVSGRIALAKAYLAKKDTERAHSQARFVLEQVADNEEAKKILGMSEWNKESGLADAAANIDKFVKEFEDDITEDMPLSEVDDTIELSPEAVEGESVIDSPAWHTVTMAQLFASQGHVERARRIYKTILERDPSNEDAKKGLSEISL